MNIPYVMKKCGKCGRWLVASTVNFHRNKDGEYGLRSLCKKCTNNKRAEYRKTNKDKILEQRKQYYEANKDKVLKQKKQYYENNKDKIAERKKQWYEANKEKEHERQKRYREANKEKIAEYQKQYREANKDKIVEKNKRWYEANKDKIAEYRKANKDKIAEYRKANKDKRAEYEKRYRQSPQGQVVQFNKSQRRRTKEEQQGTGITKDQWLELMSFFNWKCAYSGERLTKDNRSIDHIVPLDARGDNMIWNCVPMTRSLNSSKCAQNMEKWYKEQDCYDPKRLAKIYEWQEYARKKWKK